MRISRLSAVTAMLLASAAPAFAQRSTHEFSWDQATVYQVITDRFSNGDSSNDGAYGRGLDGNGNPYDVDSTGHFLGGDFSGLTAWIEEGYFNDLGVNALWISAPYEQIHGWVGGGSGEFQHYAYHGHWPLDFTETDKAFGSIQEFQTLVDTAHERGLRVVIDVVLNHVGYATMNDMAAFNFGGLTSDDWRGWRPSSKVGWQSYNDRFLTFTDSTESWLRWWGPDWIRADLPGYDGCGESESTECAHSLADTRDDRAVSDLPQHLMLKWDDERTESERASLNTFFERTGYERTAVNHIVKWLSDWVRAFGIDGFVVETAKNMNPDVYARLRDQSNRAFEDWKNVHPEKAMDETRFWMAADVMGHGIEKTDIFEYGFDSVTNFSFREDISGDPHSQFAHYADAVNSDASFNVLSFISSHDTQLFDRSRLFEAGTRLMLSPGGIVIYYGDESARPFDRTASDPVDGARSFMNWDTYDEDVSAHWQKLGRYREAHPAIARGGHDKLQDEPYAFYRGLRMGTEEDHVVVVMGASDGRTRVNVSRIWPNDTVLRDAYTGNIAIVSFGQVTFKADPSGLILMEEIK